MALKLLIQIMLVMLFFMKEASALSSSVAKPGCQERCGNLDISYPFGIGAKCSAYWPWEIYCNNSFTQPKAFLRDNNGTNLEVMDISPATGTIRVNQPPSSKLCTTLTPEGKLDASGKYLHLPRPFTYSQGKNGISSIGKEEDEASINDLDAILDYNLHGCLTLCYPWLKEDNNCIEINCCQMVPEVDIVFWQARQQPKCSQLGLSECDPYVRGRWNNNFLEPRYRAQTMEAVPVVLEWSTFGACQSFIHHTPLANRTLCGTNALCTHRSLCYCKEGYEGNPYLPTGCQDINECETTANECQQICINKNGSYTCSCKDGWALAGKFNCQKKVVDHSVQKAAILVLAICSGLGLLLATTWWLYKVIRRRRIRKVKEMFFKKNGGMLLQQQISSSQGKVETTKLFTSMELEKATDFYNSDRIIGKGGQGTVYKGMLTDGRIVAVKKSTIKDESKTEQFIEQFINEVVILSQIIHRNIVKLHGCCLETEVPLLVYEFIPNGTLRQYIDEQNEYFPLTWDVRVRVATEIAGALYYLHSAASMPIYHRDIKSSNILLDNKYRAKVADFGTSRSISIDQTHHLTRRIQGTFGYFDPEYFRSFQFTDKSDVYSFGVVLAELLTGQKPILRARLDDEEPISLATLFSSAMEENHILDILDSQIKNEGEMEEMIAFANIAYRCLNRNGRKRPTMKRVVSELESIRNSNGSPSAQQQYEEDEYGMNEINEPWESDATSTTISSTVYYSLNVEIEPLLSN